jgi:NitT/TauT family transport system substrate-binding protein
MRRPDPRLVTSASCTDHDFGSCSHHGLSRRSFLEMCAGAATIGTASLISGCTSAKKKEEPVLKIGYLPITDAAPLLIGHARGYFQAEGLTADKPVLLRGWPELSEGFLAGSFNVVHLLLPIPIYMRYSQKHPVKVVAWNHVNGSGVTVGAKSGIKRLEDVGGKQIAVPHWYSMHNIVLQMCFRQWGLEPVMQDRRAPLTSKQVNLFVMKPPDMPTAIAGSAIDGYIVAEPFNAAGEVLANGTIVRFTGDVFKNHPCCVVAMHEQDIEQHPEWAQKVVNGLVKAQQWASHNLQDAATLLSTDGAGFLPTPAPIIRRAMTKYDIETYGPNGTGAIRHPDWNAHRIDFQPYPYPSATVEIVKNLKTTKVEGDSAFLQNLDPQHVADDLFNYNLVKKAAEGIGGLQVFDNVNPANPYVRAEVIEV